MSRGLGGSASAATPTQAVEEQNLDASGFIAVHEQGTANVNVTNLTPSSKLFAVVENDTIQGTVFTTPFVNTEGCPR